MADGTWLYAVAGTPGPLLPPALHGVAGEPVRPVRCQELTAVVGNVDLAEFGEEPLRRALTDPVWVEQVARAHHKVLEVVAGLGPAVPFRLATIYRGDERVRAFVVGHRAALSAALLRVAGHAEWGVKAYLSRSAEGAATGPPGRDASGTAYLMRRRQQLHRRESDWAEAVAGADAVHETLARLANAAVRHPVQGDETAVDPDRLVLNAAYLIERTNAGRFSEAVQTLSAGGVRLHVTGPWAAYSFAAVPSDGADLPFDGADVTSDGTAGVVPRGDQGRAGRRGSS